MTRRRATITLHWLVVLFLLVQLKGGTQSDGVRLAFAACGLSICGIAMVKGLMGSPGHKLTGYLRDSFKTFHRVLYVLIGWASVLAVCEVSGITLPGPSGWTLLLILFATGTLHALFHLWRHMALYDNALRVILPKFMHKVL